MNMAIVAIITLLILDMTLCSSITHQKFQNNFDNTNDIDSTSLLKAFGITPPEEKPWKSDLPQYMLDLYQKAINSDSEENSMPYNATTVRALKESGENQNNLFSFSLEGLEFDEVVLQFEFIVHYSHLQTHKSSRIHSHKLYMLEVYILTRQSYDFIGSHMITSNEKGWHLFKFDKDILKHADHNKYLHFKVVAKDINDEPVYMTLHHGRRGSTAPLLIVFSRDVDGNGLDYPNNIYSYEKKQVKKTPLLTRSKRSVSDDIEDPEINKAENITNGCHLAPLSINFTELGWSDWLISPTTYNAGQCLGTCDFPMANNHNATNHASILLITSIIKNDQEVVKKPCCSPIAYAPLPLLYADSNDVIIFRNYPEMSVVSCGCR